MIGLKFRSIGVIALVLFGAGTVAAMIGSTETRQSLTIPSATYQSSMDIVSYTGLGPTTISLNWTMSNDPSFSKYVLQESTGSSIGPWDTVANVISSSTANNYYASWLSPGGTEWWQVLYYNTAGRETSVTNTLQVNQPAVATLSFTQPTSTALQLAWDNHATYGGLLSFGSYQLIESVNNAESFTVVSISTANSLGFDVNQLTPGTNYAFYLNTTDQCNGCAVASSSTTESNTIRISTPGPLIASAVISPHSVDVGELVYLSCSSAGGASPYSYSWTFGDGSSGTGANPNHVYNAPGMVGVVCTVTDGLGTVANSKAITFTVYVDPFITSFEATPASPDLGQSITFIVSAGGGNGSLTYSYAGLPTGCSSSNSSSFSCTPNSSGIYTVMATVLDQGMETATSTLSMSIGPPRVLGLPQAIGLAVILGSGGGIALGGLIGTVFLLRWKKQRRP